MFKKLKTFSGGVCLPDFKELTIEKKIEEAPLPEKVIIPLLGYGGNSVSAKVEKADAVKTGQLLGLSESFISSAVHASISGKITDISDYPHPDLGQAKSFVIQSDRRDQKAYSDQKKDYTELSPEQIIEAIKEAGVVGLGGASFPTHVKFSIPEGKKVDTYIVNLCECEPYLTVDQQLGIERTKDIFEGIEIAKRALAINKAYIGVEDNKKKTYQALIKESKKHSKVEVVKLRTKYPQGEEKQLIKSVLGRIVPKGKLPVDVGVVVNNTQTVLAIYEAVVCGKPLYQRVITVTGEGIKNPKNIKVRVGTPLKDILDLAGGVVKNEVAVIFGGPMTGKAVTSLDTPILKGTSSVLILPKEKISQQEEQECLRCGKCVDVCPFSILPVEVSKAVQHNDVELLEKLNVSVCTECGSCSYVCPAKIPLLERVKKAKEILAKSKKK